MTTILKLEHDKRHALELFEAVINRFVIPFHPRANQEAIAEHLSWMKLQKTDMTANCRFETNPLTNATTLQITLSFPHTVERMQ